MPYLGILGVEFENNIAVFKITTLEIFLLQNFVR